MKERQQQIYKQAIARMTELLPNWNDAIPSDPAVTVLELIAYLVELQETELDRIKAEHLLAYIRLLGEAPLALTPSKLLAVPSSRYGLYHNQRFFIDGIPFEVQDGYQYSGGQVKNVVLKHNGIELLWDENTPLTLCGEEGTMLTITFTQPLIGGVPIRLWFSLLYEQGRVPPNKATPPPFTLLCQTKCDNQWVVTAVTDDTCGFLQSGYISLAPPADTALIRLIWGGLGEGEPKLSAIIPEPVLLEQRHTRSAVITLAAPYLLPENFVQNRVLRFFIPHKDGFCEMPNYHVQNNRVTGWTVPPVLIRVIGAEPDFTATYPLQGIAMEEITLDEHGVLPDSLCLMVEEDGIYYDCPLQQAKCDTTLPRGFRWDNTKNMLCFGDGRDFEPPKQGLLLLAGCALTKGTAGNGAGGVLRQNNIVLTALQGAVGGQATEDINSAFNRVYTEQGSPLRAVTCADYEDLARCTPALALEQVRAMTNRASGSNKAGITLFAKPKSTHPRPDLTDWQRERLAQWIEQFRLIGVPVHIQGPCYVAVTVEVSLFVSAPIPDEAIRAVVLSFCDSITGKLDFGAELSYTTLFSTLGTVPNVRTVRSLELYTYCDGAVRTHDGGLQLDARCLPYLEKLTITQE